LSAKLTQRNLYIKENVMTVTVAKMKDKIVEIVRVAETVMFSEDKGWIFICIDFEKPVRKQAQFKWVKARETQFEWVREFHF